MTRTPKPSTEVKHVIDSAARLHWLDVGHELAKGERYEYRPKNTEILVTLRGHTNLEALPWAIYEGPLGTWQANVRADGSVKGTPRQISPDGLLIPRV